MGSSGFEIVEMQVGQKMVPMKEESQTLKEEFEEQVDDPSLGVDEGRSAGEGIVARESRSGTMLSLPVR